MANGAAMRKSKDGAAWIYRGHRIENRAHRHAIGGGAGWTVIRCGVVLDVPEFATLRAAKSYVDERVAALGL